MLTGSHCCFDIRGGLLGWQGGEPDWGKKCCSNEAGPVKQPPDNLNKDQLEKVVNSLMHILTEFKISHPNNFLINFCDSPQFKKMPELKENLVVKLSGFPKCLYKGGGDIFVSEYLPVVSIELSEKNQNLQQSFSHYYFSLTMNS